MKTRVWAMALTTLSATAPAWTNAARAADAVSLTPSGVTEVPMRHAQGSAWGQTRKTYGFSALNDELKAELAYSASISASNSLTHRVTAAFRARATGKVFNFVGENLTALINFSSIEGSGVASSARLEGIALRNGNIIKHDEMSTTVGTVTRKGNVVDTGDVDLYEESKSFPVSFVTVDVTAHVSGSLVVPFNGTLGVRGIQAQITPVANIEVDATGKGGVGDILSAGVKAKHVSLMKIATPTRLHAQFSGACTGLGTCTFDVNSEVRVEASALKGKLQAFAEVPSKSEHCGWNWRFLLNPIWACTLIPGSATHTKTIWDSPGLTFKETLWSANRSFVL